jgi:hypothetical protein
MTPREYCSAKALQRRTDAGPRLLQRKVGRRFRPHVRTALLLLSCFVGRRMALATRTAFPPALAPRSHLSCGICYSATYGCREQTVLVATHRHARPALCAPRHRLGREVSLRARHTADGARRASEPEHRGSRDRRFNTAARTMLLKGLRDRDVRFSVRLRRPDRALSPQPMLPRRPCSEKDRSYAQRITRARTVRPRRFSAEPKTGRGGFSEKLDRPVIFARYHSR